MRVVVLTTSYPRGPGDVAGRFIADAVERLRGRGLDVEVVSPATFRTSASRTARGSSGTSGAAPGSRSCCRSSCSRSPSRPSRAARGADLVHAHWLPSAAVALLTRKPVVAQVWGTDVELARRVPWLARAGAPARAPSSSRPRTCSRRRRVRLGAREVAVIPSGVDVADEVGDEDEPPFVLYAGRLSPEKGVLELVEAANGIPLVIVGDGPLRERVPGARGFVAHDELLKLYERAAVVAVPSYREGFGVVCAEAMAHARPVVASAVGGLLDLVADGETGIHVPPGDVAALRDALERLLADRELRRRLGEAGRERVRERFSWAAVTDATVAAYERALGERP